MLQAGYFNHHGWSTWRQHGAMIQNSQLLEGSFAPNSQVVGFLAAKPQLNRCHSNRVFVDWKNVSRFSCEVPLCPSWRSANAVAWMGIFGWFSWWKRQRNNKNQVVWMKKITKQLSCLRGCSSHSSKLPNKNKVCLMFCQLINDRLTDNNIVYNSMKLKVNIALDQHLLVGFTKIKHFTGKMFFLDGNSSVDCPWFHRLKNGRLSAGTIKAGGADDTAKTPEWVGRHLGFCWLLRATVVGWLGELGVWGWSFVCGVVIPCLGRKRCKSMFISMVMFEGFSLW